MHEVTALLHSPHSYASTQSWSWVRCLLGPAISSLAKWVVLQRWEHDQQPQRPQMAHMETCPLRRRYIACITCMQRPLSMSAVHSEHTSQGENFAALAVCTQTS